MLDMITVESLTKTYGRGLTAVDDVSFTAATGRVTGFLGPNGAGKSTTMRIMVGLTPATSGTATIDGRRFIDLPNPGTEVGCPPGRLGTARRPHRPRDPHPRPAHDGPAQGPGPGDARPGQPHRRRGRPAGARLLPRDAPAPGHRRRPPRATRTCSSSTSRRTGSTRPASAGCATSCAATPTAAAPSCSPRHLLHEIEVIADDLVVIGNGRIVAQGTKADLLASAGTVVRARDGAALARRWSAPA